MRGSGKFVLGVGFVSLFFLFYVHLNVSLLTLSYGINEKSKELDRSAEYYRHLRFEVDQLKAPHRLAERMTTLELKFDLPKEVHVIQVPAPEPMLIHQAPDDTAGFQPFSKGLSDFLGRWIKVAQAKTES